MSYLKNFKIRNPLWMASSHLTENLKSIEKCCRAGIGGVVLKGTDGRLSQPCDRNCRKCEFDYSFKGRRLFVKKPVLYSFTPNTLLCEFLSLQEIRFFLKFIKGNYPDILRIVNISAKNPDSFIKIMKNLKVCGAQAVELNIKYTIRYKDSDASDNKMYILNFLKKINKKIVMPFIVKVCPDLLDGVFLKDISRYVNGLTIANSEQVILPGYFKKRLPVAIKKKTCSIMGEPIWGLVKKYVPIAKEYVNFVSASGGIYNLKRAKEIMELGADSVQLCSGIEFSGYSLISKIKKELR